MNRASKEFNKQLELDVLTGGLTAVTRDYIERFNWEMLDEVVIPVGVKVIEYEAFAGCHELKDVTIGNSVHTIERSAFGSCRHLTNITIPASVIFIGDAAFKGSGDPGHLPRLTFKNRTIDEVRFIAGYPWDIPPENINVQDD